MNTNTRTQRLVAAVASVVVTLTLFSAVVSQAQPPVSHSLFAQAGAVHTA